MTPGADGRLRTWLNVAGTETGRFSSSETFLEASTNLQNMPKKVAALDPKYDVRDCLVPDAGNVFVEVDLSQAEARIVAALCGDQELLARWNDPMFNVHTWTAARIFKKEEDDVTESEYYIGKRSRHALNYLMGWKHFQRTVNADADVTGVSLTAGRARTIVDAYHALHPRLEEWWRRVARLLDSESTLTTPLGRRRTFFGRRSKEIWLTDVHKEAIAFVPQSTVADLLNRGLLRWWRRHDDKVGRVILQVHDSILVSVPKARASVAAKLLRACCEEEIDVNGTTLVVPADVSIGEESWARMVAA
jgi:DNA polymerase I-like protein with 3'-5' exonuclease and polymerase domains